MSRHFYLALVLMIVAMVAASSARAVPSYDAWFSGAVSTDWNDINNWEAQQPPDPNRTAVIGIMGMYEDVTCEVLTGTTTETGGLEISRYANGHLIVQSGATLNVGDAFHIGYSGSGTGTASLTINGAVNQIQPGNVTIGGKTNAVVNINEGGSLTVEGWTCIGKWYDGTGGGNTTINHNGGVFTVNFESGTAVETRESSGFTMHHKMSGGTINVPNGGWWNQGGTFEVAGQAQVNTFMRFTSDWDGDMVMKFSGTDPLYTTPNFAYFRGDGNTYLDVSELTLSTSNTWVTVMDCNDIWGGSKLVFAPGTDTNVWSMQFPTTSTPDPNDPNTPIFHSPQLQLMYGTGLLMGDCNRSGYVDDDDLSLLLANWHATTTWDYGNLSDSDTPPGVMGYVDDDDLSLLLANWHAGTAPMGGEAVPEPATIALLALGGFGALMRRRR